MDLEIYDRIAELAADMRHGASVYAKTAKVRTGNRRKATAYAEALDTMAEAHAAIRKELIALISSLPPLSH